MRAISCGSQQCVGYSLQNMERGLNVWRGCDRPADGDFVNIWKLRQSKMFKNVFVPSLYSSPCSNREGHLNHGRATDCRATWDNGSTVSDARQLLARTSRRFESGQVDPDIARKVRESLLSASTSGRPKEADPTSAIEQPKNRFPTQ